MGHFLHGYLDRLRENVEALDEAVANARMMGKSKNKGDNALQWTKTLRDLVELRNQTLDRIKAHLLGRNETGTITEPEDAWDKNPQVMFERYFKEQLSPWTEQDLKLECEDCGLESEDVFSRSFEKQVPLGIGDMMTTETEHHDLCPNCYTKRQTKDADAGH